MHIKGIFYLIILTLFNAHCYASDDLIHIARIDDDRLLVKKIDSTITKSARKFFHRNAHNFGTEERKVYDVTYKKFYFINNNDKDVLLTLNFAPSSHNDPVKQIPTKILVNLKNYRNFMHDYEVYLGILASENLVNNVHGKDYYKASIARIIDGFNTFNQCINSLVFKKHIYLSELSLIINTLSTFDRNKARIQDEIRYIEDYIDQEKKQYRFKKIIIKDFVTGSDTLNN